MREVGALLDARALHGGRRAFDHLLCLARSNGIARSRVEEVLRIAGLEGVARRRAKGLSLGMSQRLGIASALLGDPAVFIPVKASLEEAFMELTRDSVEYQAAGVPR